MHPAKKEMGKKRTHQLAQSSIDLLLLFGTVMVVFIPLIYYSNENVDIVRESQIAEGLWAVKNAVGTLIEIGAKSRITEIITNPSGITGYNITDNLINVYFKDQNVSAYFQLPIFDKSRWPITQGIHRISIYNDGNYIIFTECGNNVIEAYEQCDGTAGVCPTGTCNPPGSANECACTCVGVGTTGNPCPPGYGCNGGLCTPAGCAPGYFWINGKCCPDLDDDTYYGTDGICPSPIDCDDNNPAVPNFSPGGETALGGPNACFNNIDDDCDGFIDCADPDCNLDPACTSDCSDGNLDPGEECDDGNTNLNDGCDNNCEIELLWDITPKPPWINHAVAPSLKNANVAPYINAYAAATGAPTIIGICNQQCSGTCPGTPICTFDTSIGEISCPETVPGTAGNYDRCAYIWSKADTKVLNVMDPNAGVCGNGVLNSGEQCETCNINSNCGTGVCINGVCAYDPSGVLSSCEYKQSSSTALFNTPSRSVADISGNIYVADKLNHRIRKVYPNGMVITLAGGNTGGGSCGGVASTKCNDGNSTNTQFN